MPSNESIDGPATNGNTPIHSLDLPQLYKRPSFSEILQVLELLKLPPPSWNSPSRRSQESDDAQGISRYLTKIIGSELDWLSLGVSEEEWEERCETIHELASKRLAERCGRSGQQKKEVATSKKMIQWLVESKLTVRIELTMGSDEMMKPNTIMNDNATIGGETVVLSGSTLESNLIHPAKPAGNIYNQGRVLELGSGTGLLGLTAAMLWNKPTVLTDLPDIVPNLDVNLKRNGFDRTSESKAKAEILDWSDAEGSVVFSQDPNNKFEIILVADPFYDSHHPPLLAGVIPKFLKNTGDGRILVSVPLRDSATEAMRNDFVRLMAVQGYQLLASGRERCFDDWEESELDDGDGVHCWWGMWKHAIASSSHAIDST
ncbi:hypothetical protein DID88_008626 [Monilinia fructigena]|uniref:Uncharacterized protein n=1 Tax=Monilinia fructigena TaxID=38457 RepID=A0A395J6D3_9HELO|nr:hypothetical protein DID88_008626 [Monilinia fructigena]